MNNIDEVYRVEGEGSYLDVLTAVQRELSANYKSVTLSEHNRRKDDVHIYRNTIQHIVMDNNLKCRGFGTLSDLVDRLYNTMVEYDVLTDLLKPEYYMEYGIEEIYGRWNAIRIKCKKGKVLLPDTFPSKEVADSILLRIAQRCKENLNDAQPIALGEFAPNIRASITTAPITPEQHGTEFCIRIVHGSKMTRSLLINGGTVSSDGLDFLELCVKHKVGICISGSTGSGKTGTMYYLLSQVTQDDTYRVSTIEVESREIDLYRYDAQGRSTNDVFSWATRSSDDPKRQVSGEKLVETGLRFTADIYGMGEMRDREAASVCEVGATGHGVITTTHCDSAEDTPMRLFTLCKKSQSNYDDATVFMQIRKAFPIIVHQRMELDGTRRIYEIAEFVGCANGEPIVNNIYEYVVTDNIVEQRKTIGSFQKVGDISDSLCKKLLRNGASRSMIDKHKGGQDD